MDDEVYNIIKDCLDKQSTSIGWLCRHTSAMESMITDMRGDIQEIKECVQAHDIRIGKAEKRIRYVEGKMYIVVAVFIVVIAAIITNGMV